jgi:molybdopterin-guanine dinucleotide biosynthesis protein A
MGADKARLELHGRTLLDHAVAALDRACGEVWLATGDTPRYAELGRRIVLDRSAGLGPLAGLEAALANAPEGWVAILACDMPAVDALLVARLFEAAESGADDAVMLGSSAGVEPLCAVYHTRLAVCARAALDAGDRRMIDLFAHPLADGRRPRYALLDERALGRDGASANLNTAVDLERARQARGHADPRPGAVA